MSQPVILTIAGSDSGGGAGIQADLKTFQAFGCFGTSAITAVTAQNTIGVLESHALPPTLVQAQIEAVVSDLRPAALKTGMLANRPIIDAVAHSIERGGLVNFVLDPVMVATSGDALLDRGAEELIRERLAPLSTLITPNLDEASILVGYPVDSEASMRRAAEDLVGRSARAALIKGGHLSGDFLVDILFDGSEWREWRRPRMETRNTHGTGCTLSAAIAANLGLGGSVADAVDRSLDYLQRAIRTAPGLGSGHGPVNHNAATV